MTSDSKSLHVRAAQNSLSYFQQSDFCASAIIKELITFQLTGQHRYDSFHGHAILKAYWHITRMHFWNFPRIYETSGIYTKVGCYDQKLGQMFIACQIYSPFTVFAKSQFGCLAGSAWCM